MTDKEFQDWCAQKQIGKYCWVVYGITYKDQLIYIGLTSNFERRKYQHLNNIDNGKKIQQLYQYCYQNNIKAKDVVIKRMTEAYDKKTGQQLEKNLITFFKPVGNAYIY